MKTQITLITFFIISFSSTLCYSQLSSFKDSIIDLASHKENDSIKINFILDEIWKVRRSRTQNALELTSYLDDFNVAHSINYKDDKRIYYKGILYKNMGKYDSSEVYLKQYAEIKHIEGEKKKESAGYQALCNLYYDQGLFEKSMKAVTKTLALSVQVKDTFTILTSKNKLASILLNTGQTQKALAIQKEVLKMAIQQENVSMICNSTSDIGSSFEELNQLDSMLFYYIKSYEIARENNLEHHLIYSYYNLGVGHKQNNELPKALQFYQLSFDQAKTLDDPLMLEYARLGLADVALLLKDYLTARNHLSIALENSNSIEQKKDIYERLYKTDKALEKYNLALHHLEQHKVLSDSLIGSEVQNQINELEAKYDTQKKTHEIEKLTLEDQIKSDRLSNQVKWIFGLMSGLLILGFLLFRMYLQKRKINDQKEAIGKALDEKEILMQEIHHRVKNNLQVISSLLSLQSRSTEDKSTSSALLEGQNRVQSMALIHQHLYKGNNVTGVSMKEYIENLSKTIFLSHNLDPENIKLILKIAPIELDLKTVVPLGLVLNELITNACKYAFQINKASVLMIQLTLEDDILNLRVKDNGMGYDPSKITKGFGSKIIDTFAKKMKAEIVIKNDNGADVEIKIKEFQIL